MSWYKVKLGKLGRVVTGKTPPTKDPDNFGSDFPFITPGDMHGTKFANATERKLSLKGGGVIKGSRLPAGSVCVSCIGSDMGNVLFTTCDSFTNQQINSIIPSVQYCADFIYYLMKTKKSEILGIGTAGGSAVPIISKSEFCDLDVAVPDLSIQRRIASVLGAYDDLIENNRRRIALLEKMARELYCERFVRRAGKGNTVTLGEIMSITRGLSYTSKEIDTEDGVNLINLKNIRSFGGFREEGTKKYSGDYKNAQVVKKGDLVMGVTDMTQDRRTVGAVALLPDLEGESVLSADLIKIDSDFGNCFLFCMFCYGGVSSQIGQFATGATVLHLRPQAVLDFSVTLPPREEVEEFESQIFPLFEEQGNLLSQNRSLSRQRDKLLPRLMSGKINVEDLAKEEK